MFCLVQVPDTGRRSRENVPQPAGQLGGGAEAVQGAGRDGPTAGCRVRLFSARGAQQRQERARRRSQRHHAGH